MKVDAPLRSIANSYKLAAWVDSKRCCREEYFASIDLFILRLKAHEGPAGPTKEPPWKALAALVAVALDEEGALYDYTESKNLATDDEATWAAVTLAAAWVILRRYEKAVNDGDWPKP